MVVVVVAGILLLSMGGAIVAAPITVPLLWVTGRSAGGRRVRVGAAVVAALTTAEVVWLAVYNVAGEVQPTVWLIPLLAAVVTGLAIGRRR